MNLFFEHKTALHVGHLVTCTIIGARLAQSVEHETLNLRVVGSSPTLGGEMFFFIQSRKIIKSLEKQ